MKLGKVLKKGMYGNFGNEGAVHFKGISKAFQRHFKGISKAFQMHFKGISKAFQMHFKGSPTIQN